MEDRLTVAGLVGTILDRAVTIVSLLQAEPELVPEPFAAALSTAADNIVLYNDTYSQDLAELRDGLQTFGRLVDNHTIPLPNGQQKIVDEAVYDLSQNWERQLRSKTV